jgi:hypothetical protein
MNCLRHEKYVYSTFSRVGKSQILNRDDKDRIHTGKKEREVILGIIFNFNVIRKILLNFLQYIKPQFHISGFIFSKFLSGQQNLHLKIANFYRGSVLNLLFETSKSPAVKPN